MTVLNSELGIKYRGTHVPKFLLSVNLKQHYYNVKSRDQNHWSPDVPGLWKFITMLSIY